MRKYTQNDEDQYLMQNIEDDIDGGFDEECNQYEVEYREVIGEMSRICSIMANNSKVEKDKKIAIK